MHFPGLALLSLLLPLSAAAQAGPPAAPARVVSAPALPTEAGAYRLVSTRIHTDSLLGTWYEYAAGRDRRFTVMVQPSLGVDHRTATAADVIARAARSFRSARADRPAGEFVRDQPDTLAVGSRTLPGHVVAAVERAEAAERLVALHVYHLGSRYVRVQGTLTGGRAELAAASGFVRSIVPAVILAWQP